MMEPNKNNLDRFKLSKLHIPLVIGSILSIVAMFDIILSRAFCGEFHDLLVYQIIFPDNSYLASSLWNNNWITGFPIFADPQSYLYYPFASLINIAIDNIFLQANTVILVHLIIAFITCYIFLSLFCNNKCYLITFSAAYTFSAMMLLRVYAGHEVIVCALALLPLLYYLIYTIIDSKETNIVNLTFFIITTTLIIQTGAMYQVAFSFMFLTIYLIYHYLSQNIDLKKIISVFAATALACVVSSIKLIPVLEISGQITRVDGAVDVYNGGGSIESDLASFIFGQSINEGYAYTGMQYGIHESAVLIGCVLVFLAIIALTYGKKTITVPAFLSIIFALIWAAAGKTLFSFIHLLPFLNTLRCPGRIFGALLPIIIMLSLYGLIIISQKLKDGESFKLDPEQKKYLTYGVAALILVKIFELPYQEAITVKAGISILLVAALIAVIYINKLDKNTIIAFFAAGLLINIFYLVTGYAFTIPVIIKTCILAALIIGIFLYELGSSSMHQIENPQTLTDTENNENNPKLSKTNLKSKTDKKVSHEQTNTALLPADIQYSGKYFTIISTLICISIIAACAAGFTYLKPVDPDFESSPANAIIKELEKYPSNNAQAWAATTGWPYQDMKYTYLFMINGIHAQRGYNAYYLNTMLPISYNIGNTPYFTSDYIIDTAYLDSGELAIPNYTFMADGVPVTVMENVLPNAFILRNGNEIIKPTVEKFTPDEVVITGDFKAGDIAVLKTAYYNGWKINGEDTVNAGNMPATELKSDTQKIVYNFAPASFTIGLSLTLIGIIILIAMIVFRKKVEELIK